MKGQAGRVLRPAEEMAPVPGCTVSEAISAAGGNNVVWFSLAEATDISAESYERRRLWYVASGAMEAVEESGNTPLAAGDFFVVPVGTPVGVRTERGAVYLEISLQEGKTMNKAIEDKKVFQLAELLPCQDGKIVNMDLVQSPNLKFVLMSFGAGTGLDEHAAPGEALVFALEGEAVIGYEGKEYTVHAGENFKFAKNGRHYVRAVKNFKMALMLELA